MKTLKEILRKAEGMVGASDDVRGLFIDLVSKMFKDENLTKQVEQSVIEVAEDREITAADVSRTFVVVADGLTPIVLTVAENALLPNQAITIIRTGTATVNIAYAASGGLINGVSAAFSITNQYKSIVLRAVSKVLLVAG